MQQQLTPIQSWLRHFVHWLNQSLLHGWLKVIQQPISHSFTRRQFRPGQQPLIRYLALALLCFGLVVGCGQSNPSSEGNPTTTTGSDRLTIGTTLKPRTLDPADSYEVSGLMLIYNLGESLYTYELGTTELKAQLATALPEVSEDGLTYTISLREGVTFHDGSLFNAEAMAFSLERFITNGGKPAFLLADTIESVTASGEFELTIKLQQPFAGFTALLAFPGACAVSPQAYEIGEGNFSPNQFVGTGPYQLSAFNSDSIQLDTFADYWGEAPQNQGVALQIYASNSANLFNAFRRGDVDVAYQTLDPQQISTLQTEADNDKWQVIAAPGTAVSFMVLNLRSEPLDQLEVRQAIATLIDRKLLNDRVLQGQGESLYSLVPTTFDAYEPVFETTYGKAADSDRAQELLATAGYTPDNPATVEVWYPSGSNIRASVATTLKALAQQELAGALVFEPKTVESASFFGNVSQGIYPSYLVDWYPDFLDADNYLQPFLSCADGSPEAGCNQGAAQNQGSFYYSDRANDLIDQERREKDPQKRQQIFTEIQTLLAQDVPYIPLWQNKDYAFAQNDIAGVTINPSQNFPFWTLQRTSGS